MAGFDEVFVVLQDEFDLAIAQGTASDKRNY